MKKQHNRNIVGVSCWLAFGDKKKTAERIPLAHKSRGFCAVDTLPWRWSVVVVASVWPSSWTCIIKHVRREANIYHISLVFQFIFSLLHFDLPVVKLCLFLLNPFINASAGPRRRHSSMFAQSQVSCLSKSSKYWYENYNNWFCKQEYTNMTAHGGSARLGEGGCTCPIQ